MAVVTFEFRKDLHDALDYVTKERGDDDVISSLNCEVEDAEESFRNTKRLHEKTGDTQVLELLQSFPPKERDMKTPEEFHEMGKQLAETLFPGFEAVIRTHTDRGHIHNHIILNTVHMETGSRICDERLWGSTFGPPKQKNALEKPEAATFAAVYHASKTPEQYNWRFLHVIRRENDRIARDAGLSVLEGKRHERDVKIPKEVLRMERARKDSWFLDLVQKATFARAYATSYDEFSGILREFGITARVEGKNVSFTYPGDQRRKVRGKGIGKAFEKQGLERAFANNDQMFANRPEVRSTLRSEISSLHSKPGRIVRDSSGVLLEPGGARTLLPKDYGAYTPIARPGRGNRNSSDLDLRNSIIPIEEIQRAKRSIPEYCKQNKIALTTDEKGRTVLKGRKHVVVNEFEVINTRSKVSGSLIDFVAIHQKSTYLQAIATINNNPRLLLLEEYWGERKRQFNTFYIPKPERAKEPEATRQLSKFLRTIGGSDKAARGLIERNQAHVSKSGVIHLFGEGDGSGALALSEGPSNAWTERKLGKARAPFYSSKPKSNSVRLFLDAKHFIAKHGDEAFASSKRPQGLLALLSPEHEPVDHYVNKHRDVHSITLVHAGKKPTKDEIDFFGVLKGRYQSHKINVAMVGPEHEMSRSRGPDLSL